MAQWANTFFGSILTWRVVFSNGFALRLNFASPAPITEQRFCHNSRPYKTRFGNEFGPSSLAADWGNHGCFLFLRWVICLSSAGSPATLRSVNKKWENHTEKMNFLRWFHNFFCESGQKDTKLGSFGLAISGVVLLNFNQTLGSLFVLSTTDPHNTFFKGHCTWVGFCCSTLRCGMHGDDSWRASPMRLLRSKIR